MVKWLEEVSVLLGKKGEEMYQELKKLLDKVLEWIKKNSKRFEKEIKNSKQIQKQIQKMWDDFSYKDLLEIPPTKKPCFLAGTLVKTESGKVAIENIVIGQRVYAYNANTNEPELRTVTKTYRNRTERYICINTKNGMIEATGLHCFWSLEENKWVPANSLKTGMNLLDAKGQHISITSLEIIESIENTYDLEIEDLHSYYVGTDEVLTHNKNRVSIFASTELIDVEFYAILGENRETIYIGQTTQGYDIRYAQHRRDPKKILWRAKMKGVYDLSINGKSGPFKMTPYEAAVIEFYEINRSGGIGKNNKGLYNKQPPIGKKKFEQFKKLGTFNPCRFYV